MDLLESSRRLCSQKLSRRKRSLLLAHAAGMAIVALIAPSDAWAQYQPSNNPVYDPGSYYNNATANDGPTLKSQLYTITSTGFIGRTYGDTRYAARVLFKDTTFVPTAQNPYDKIIWVYERTSNDYQWDAGVTWNREHSWPQSKLGVSASNGTANRASDLFEVYPSNSHTNSSRGNSAYGDTSGGFFYPGDADRGDVARGLFYMATRYGSNQSAGNLSLTAGQGGTNQMGDLPTLLRWHYIDGVDNFERRRNWLTYTSDSSAAAWDITPPQFDPTRNSLYNQVYNQGNRNPYIDHPEYVWAVFGGGVANTSKLYVGASAPGDGASATTVMLPRVMKNGTLGSSSVTMTKAGTTPTTFDITTGGSATSTVAGKGRPFVYEPGTLSIPVGLNASTSTTGLKTGTVTIDNTDLTSAGSGMGAQDGNDVITVQAQVVDNRVITATNASFGRVLVGQMVTANTTLSSPGDDNNNTRITVTGTASAADANGVAIAAGSNTIFNGTTTTAIRTFEGNFSTPGDYNGSRSFTRTGEGLAGETVNAVSSTYSAKALGHASPSFTSDGTSTSKTIDFGYVPSGFAARTGTFSIFNNPVTGDPTYTAGLDIDGDSPSGSGQITTNVTSPQQIAAGASHGYVVTYTPTTSGDAGTTHTITSSDEDLPGAIARPNLTYAASGYTLTSAVFPHTGFMHLLTGETYNTGLFSIENGSTIQFTGPGTMNITGAQTNSPGSALDITDGMVHFNTDAGSSSAATLAVNASGPASVMFNATQHLTTLNVTETTVSVSPGANKVIAVNALNLDPAARLDLSDNKLVVRGGIIGTISGNTYSDLAGLIQTARNGGNWSSPGITTSQSDAQSGAYTTLGISTAAEARGIGASDTTTWAGETVNGSDVLVMYTYAGDATVDGKINVDDYIKIDNGIGNALVGFSNGDFNYDGKINIDDYTFIDNNLVNQGLPFETTLSFGSVSAVPEPAAMSLFTLAGSLLLRRSRRRAAHI